MKSQRTCGSCLHLDRDKAFTTVCSQAGILPTSAACNTFKPDLYALAHPETQNSDLELVGDALGKMSLSQLAILSALADRERVTRKYGYRFFQRVYVRYVGPASNNYLSNFMSARILDVDSKSIRLIGDSDYRAYIVLEHTKGRTSSLFKAPDFGPLRQQMIQEKKFVDPSLKRGSKLTAPSAKGQLANLDNLVPESVDLRTLGLKRQKADDLVSLVGRMSKGMYGTRESRASSEVEMVWSQN